MAFGSPRSKKQAKSPGGGSRSSKKSSSKIGASGALSKSKKGMKKSSGGSSSLSSSVAGSAMTKQTLKFGGGGGGSASNSSSKLKTGPVKRNTGNRTKKKPSIAIEENNQDPQNSVDGRDDIKENDTTDCRSRSSGSRPERRASASEQHRSVVEVLEEEFKAAGKLDEATIQAAIESGEGSINNAEPEQTEMPKEASDEGEEVQQYEVQESELDPIAASLPEGERSGSSLDENKGERGDEEAIEVDQPQDAEGANVDDNETSAAAIVEDKKRSPRSSSSRSSCDRQRERERERRKKKSQDKDRDRDPTKKRSGKSSRAKESKEAVGRVNSYLKNRDDGAYAEEDDEHTQFTDANGADCSTVGGKFKQKLEDGVEEVQGTTQDILLSVFQVCCAFALRGKEINNFVKEIDNARAELR